MNNKKIIKELKKKYPGKKIILNPPENPTEIICEIDPTSKHPEKSVALAIIGKSRPHYHKKSTEIYEAVRGTLTVYKNSRKHILQEGQKITIEPNVVHYAKGNESWFLTHSTPGWTFEDHIIVDNSPLIS
ncbi:cupin domain-containing protein [Candidatus Roizmanbacteria bacterium]|nr:cupin domain-containing protein [Candidatus Roizmanbacteria bacterium]